MSQERAKGNAEAAYNFLKRLRDLAIKDGYVPDDELLSDIGCCAAHLEEAIKELS